MTLVVRTNISVVDIFRVRCIEALSQAYLKLQFDKIFQVSNSTQVPTINNTYVCQSDAVLYILVVLILVVLILVDSLGTRQPRTENQ